LSVHRLSIRARGLRRPLCRHFTAPSDGVCGLEWSNEHSWMTGKELRYTIECREQRQAAAAATAEPEPE
jgi:hypothetical protein